MWEKEREELLQDYRYRKNILQEITLSDIEKWNNMDVNVDWDKITNKPSTFPPSTHTHNFEDLLEKPTTLEGYGITDVYTKDEIQDNTLNKIKATSGKVLVDTGFSLGLKDGDNLISYNYGTSGAPTLKLGVNAYISSYMSNMDIVAPTQLMLKTDNLNLKTKLFNLQGNYGSFSVDVSDNKANNKLYASIPAEFADIVKAPRINIYSGNNTVLEGALWNSTYNINGAIKDGLHLSHENGKYLALAYKNASTGIYNSYMILDVEGVLKNDSDGDDWGPVRFEQSVFFRHGLKIGGGEDITLAGKGVNTRITALENAITQGTGMVEWNNVLNKPSTFPPSSHSHTISEITNLQTTLDGKASSTHNHDSVYVKQDGSTPITSRQQLKMGSYVFEAGGLGNSGGWMLIAEIKIKSTYINQPLKLDISGRGRHNSVILWILYEGTPTRDPRLISFEHSNVKGYQAYLIKTATSTWNLYVNKTEPYDNLDITDIHIPKYTDIEVTYKNISVSSMPDGGTYATPLQHSISEITNLQTTLDGKLSTDNGLIATQYGCIILSNTQGYLGKDKIGATHVIGLIGNDNYCYLGGNLINTYIRSKDCPQYLDSNGKKYNLYHTGNFNPSNYLTLSGGTITGELALTQDKGIISANAEGGTLLVETSTSVSVGKTTKNLNLNCSLAYMNGARVLTEYNYASYVLPKTIFAGLFSPNETIGTDSNTYYNYSKKTVYKSADCTVGTDRITISKAGTYKVTATWGGVPKSGTANTSAMRFTIQQRNSSSSIASKVDTITVTTLNRTAKSTVSYLFKCSANDYFIFFSYFCTVTFESEDVEIEIVRIS